MTRVALKRGQVCCNLTGPLREELTVEDGVILKGTENNNSQQEMQIYSKTHT